MSTLSGYIKQAFGKWWRKFIADECPDARIERIRKERIGHIQVCADLRQAFHLWELNHQKNKKSRWGSS